VTHAPVLPDLTARQFWQAALVLGITEDNLANALTNEDSPLYIEDETNQAETLIDIRKATSFRRNHPLIDEIATAHAIPPEQMNSLWRWAATIE